MYTRKTPAPARPDRESTIATGHAGPDLNSRPCPLPTEAASLTQYRLVFAGMAERLLDSDVPAEENYNKLIIIIN